MIKKIILFLFSFLCLSSAFARGNVEELNVYSLISSSYSSKILSDFSSESGIKVNIKEITLKELEPVLEEDKWGDIILGGLGMDHQRLSDSGFLTKANNQNGINKDLFGSANENQWIVININTLVFLSNNDFLDRYGLSPPMKWNDILYPAYNDEIVLTNPMLDLRIGRIYNLELLFGENGAIKFQQALDKNVVNYYEDSNIAASLVQLGEVGFTITDSQTALRIVKSGAPVTISFPEEGVIYGETCCSIVKDCKNYNNARIFIDWLLSDSYSNCIKNNNIPFVLPEGINDYKDDYINFTEVNFLKTDFAWKINNKEKFIADFDNYIMKNRL